MPPMTSSAHETHTELTLRGIVIAVLITLVFTAANVYFGLKAGLTFATSIPAAVISMAILHRMRGATVQENNIVQTVASAAGTLSAIIFVLPGLVIIGWWSGFPYWETVFICGLGGVLGVMYSIPLRRALVTGADLPYPEGVACAEVLKVGAAPADGADDTAGGAGQAGFRAVIVGAVASAAFTVAQATQVLGESMSAYFRVGARGSSGISLSLSLALLAVGHLVGLWVGIAMLLGTGIAWIWAVPHFSALLNDNGSAAELALSAFGHSVRFVGAGAIGAAAIWTLVKLVQPVGRGLAGALRASHLRKTGRGSELPRVEQDIPVGVVALVTLMCMLPIAWLLADFSSGAGLRAQLWTLTLGGVAFVALISFFVAAVVGYMAGLVGSSNSPISGVGILVVVIAAVLLAVAVQPYAGPAAGKALVAYALFVSAVVFAGATIANDNLQDLKTGQLVDATPWRQQVALIIGVVAGALIIPFVLNMLNEAYGFVGAPNATDRALAAPQAVLISELARGVLQHDMDWSLIWLGVAMGGAVIVVDEMLGRLGTRMRLPPLAVGLGVYLPPQITLMIAIGALAGWHYNRRAEHAHNPGNMRQLGVLMSSGLIVGESILGVIIAAIVVFSGREAPLALVDADFAAAAPWLGTVAFMLLVPGLYRWVAHQSR